MRAPRAGALGRRAGALARSGSNPQTVNQVQALFRDDGGDGEDSELMAFGYDRQAVGPKASASKIGTCAGDKRVRASVVHVGCALTSRARVAVLGATLSRHQARAKP